MDACTIRIQYVSVKPRGNSLNKIIFFRQIYNGIRMIPNLAQNPVTATIQTTKRGVLGMHVT